MRSAISTGIIGTIPLHPRRLQLYPSLGKHFQTSPVPVHFNGNKMMMKMQTTYSSHVPFCTKSSGGLSKQQDYSNTNTAVSLLPPTQETPKMILRRILVSIVSSAALLLYSSLFISHCFARTKQYVPRNIKYDDCSVCQVVALQLFKEIKEDPPLDSEQDDLETDIIDIAEDVCENVHWIREIPIEKENLENNEIQVCDLGCRKTICDEVMEKFDGSVFAKFINEQWWSDGKFESLKTHLCENLTHACSTGHDEPKKNAEGQVCKLQKNDDWIRHLPIEEGNLENNEIQVCDLGCRKTICIEIMGNVTNHAIAELVCKQWSDGEFESLKAPLKAYLCENQTKVCSIGLDEPKKVEHKHVEEPEVKKNEKNGWKKFKFWGRS